MDEQAEEIYVRVVHQGSVDNGCNSSILRILFEQAPHLFKPYKVFGIDQHKRQFDLQDLRQLLSEQKIMAKFYGGARKGAVGRAVDIVNIGNFPGSFSPGTVIEFEDHNNHRYTAKSWDPVRYYTVEASADMHSKWVFVTKAKEQVDPPVNAWGQTLEVGKIVAGVSRKTLYIGKVTRYTAKNVWIQTYANIRTMYGGQVDQQSREIMLNSPLDTVLLPTEMEHAMIPMRMLGAPMPDPDTIFGVM